MKDIGSIYEQGIGRQDPNNYYYYLKYAKNNGEEYGDTSSTIIHIH